MSDSTIDSAIEEAMRAGKVPGIAVAVARGPGPLEYHVAGADARGEPLAPDTLFPVASITKMATALAVLRLCDTGVIALDDELEQHVPEAVAARPGVTLRALLCHAAGLPIDVAPGAAPYAAGLDWHALGQACMLTPPEAEPWARVQYSNVGYGLLALAVERRTDQPFADTLARLVLGPLGAEAYLGAEPPRPPAAQADVRGRHAGTPLEPFNSHFYRSLALPWAGLVTSAAGALAIVRAFRDPRFLSPQLGAAASSDQTGGLAGGFVEPLRWSPCPWGLGPDVLGAKSPHWAPPEAGADSFGHSGASGCLAWCAPGAGVAWAILGARTADNGWLLRRAPAIGAAILAAAPG
jgi:beta-lactamase class C